MDTDPRANRRGLWTARRRNAFARTLGARIKRFRIQHQTEIPWNAGTSEGREHPRGSDNPEKVVAKAIGIARQTIHGHECGKILLPTDRVPTLCTALAITPGELFLP